MGVEIRWIPVRQTVSKDESVHADDRVVVHVRLLPVLEPDVQDTILRDELAALGWTRQDDGMTKTVGHAKATLAAGSTEVVIEVAANTTVSAEATAEAKTQKGGEAAARNEARKAADAEASRQLAAKASAAQAALVTANNRDLEHAVAVIQRDVTDATNATTKRALVTRAATIGAIEQTIEGKDKDGGYELTLVVRT
jgi:hypothetical protein